METGRHYALQRYWTWDWLDYEAPLFTRDGPEWARSAYGIMNATVPAPAAHRLVANDGRPMFEEWGTFVHVQIDDPGRVRRIWTGIVSEATLTSAGWDLTILEHPGYLKGEPYQGLIRGVRDDPAVLARQLVNDVQAFPNAWYGCKVEGSTPVRLGSDLDDQIAAARAAMDARRQTLNTFTKAKVQATLGLQDSDSTLADEVTQARSLVAQAQSLIVQLTREGAPVDQVEQARQTLVQRQAEAAQALAGYNLELAAGRAALNNARRTKEEAQKAYDSAKATYDALTARRQNGEGAYIIDGDDLPDSYTALQDLCRTAGVEWTTETRYSEGAPDLAIVVHYPRAGGRRDDLVFDTSVNIINALELDRLEYYNAAVGVGSGEGAAAIRGTVDVPTLRMRRTVEVENKAARTKAQITARMREALSGTTGELFPTEIEVRDHPNCRIGSWQVGDLIQITGVTTIGTRWSGLARIESWSWPSMNRARLQLAPA